MRSSFGQFAQALRAKRKITQTDFAKQIDESIARVSNLEHQRTNIGDEVIGKYIQALNCNGKEALELRDLAQFSNTRLSVKNKEYPLDRLHAVLAQYGNSISSEAVSKINEVLVGELGPKAVALEFSSTASISKVSKSKPKQKRKRPDLSLPRFVEISVRAQKIRSHFAEDTAKLDVEGFLQDFACKDLSFDVDIVSTLPSFAHGAFACIVGHATGATVLVEASRFTIGTKSRVFVNHVLCHEFAHFILHGDLLETEQECYLPVQDAAKLAIEAMDCAEMPEGGFQKNIDSLTEEEAECFATMLLVPWTQFIKGTEDYFLARDFGEELGSINRYSRYFKNPAVLDKFREVLWKSGERDHPIFRKSN